MKDKEKQITKVSFSVIDNKTGGYPDLYKIALKEDWAKGLMYCDMEGFAINEDGQLILSDECGKFVYCPSDRFTIVFEDSVVLSREELEAQCFDYYRKGYKLGVEDFNKARKETAEKIFERIKIKVLCEDMTEDRPQTLYRFTAFDIMKMAREIVEEFGVVFENGHTSIKEYGNEDNR